MSVAEAEAREVQLEGPSSGLWGEAWHRLRHNPGAIAGFVIVGIFVFVALFAPLVAIEDPRGRGIEDPLSRLGGSCCPGPSAEHPFGIDQQGRDEFSRVVYGARYSLLIGVVSVAVGLSIGLIIGGIAGFFGGWIDSVLMRLMDIMLAVPGLLLAIGIVAALGPGVWQIMVAVGVTQIPIFARLLRGSILGVRESDYVLAARSVGVRRRAILGSHVLPNSLSPVIVQGTLALATAIIDVAGLGFLGLGPQDPGTPEWGTMLTDTTRYLQTAPHLALIPGAAIVITVLGFNLIGDGLREAMDPRFRGRA
jgi:ABC-type dipeptide/oligopeptide/nickel transport system permease subunit